MSPFYNDILIEIRRDEYGESDPDLREDLLR